MNELEIELSDFDAALTRLDRAGRDADETRRSIREALDHLYSLEASTPGYWGRVPHSVDGQTSAALTLIRGRAVHRLIRAHAHQPLCPSPTTYPSPYLAPGGNWVWLDWPSLDPLLPNDEKEATRIEQTDARRGYVRELLAGRLVRETFAFARRFFTA